MVLIVLGAMLLLLSEHRDVWVLVAGGDLVRSRYRSLLCLGRLSGARQVCPGNERHRSRQPAPSSRPCRPGRSGKQASAGSDAMEYPLIFLAGIAGSWHCVGMCGGFACTLGYDAHGRPATLARQLVYNLGRVTTY